MAGNAKNPLRIQGKPGDSMGAWDRLRVLDVVLPRLATMSLQQALAEGYSDGRRRYGLPGYSTIVSWGVEDPQIANMLAHARKPRASHLVEEAMAIVDEEPRITPKGVVDNGAVRHAEIRAKSRQWLAERLDPDTYGSRVSMDVTHHGAIDVRSVLAEAQGRVIEGKARRMPEPAELSELEDALLAEPGAAGGQEDAADLFE